ncbi:DUF2169 family type VI secretion system accessory protein [Thauera butanivorans]|uniref:DUF2169 family type VI secretion system accessory protein n=1 Tax=Thauera butanivorans TaxID=86174 RepID=UPI003AB8D932
MWQIDNHSPFAVGREWIRDVDGREVWIVAVKATYDILADGSTRIATEQPPVLSGPVKDEDGSPRYDTDLGPPKPATDIILAGHAYAQGGRPVTELQAGFQVGKLQRMARIVGGRQWKRSLLGTSPTPPESFVCMPLTWTRSLGGTDEPAVQATGNPVGCGLAVEGALPNIEHPAHPLASLTKLPPVFGFGPVPRHWPWRMRYAGTYDEVWSNTRRPLQPIDLDPRHWQIAPPEQQYPGYLRGGEEVMLTHLVPPAIAPKGRLSFQVPKLSLSFETRFYDNTRERSRSRIHTLILEPDHPRIGVVHHMALPCHPKVNLLDRTIIRVKQRPLDRPLALQGARS